VSEIRFKVAEEPREREQVHRLHYQAFVEEIPQYVRNEERRLVDRFDDQNTYIVAMNGDVVVGSIAVRGERPFSLDQKLQNLDGYLPARHRFCEIRLLSVLKQHRRGNVLPGLITGAWNHAMAAGYDGALISGTTRQLRLYAHLGFVPFGPLVGTAEAAFQPMYVTTSGFTASAQTISSLPLGPRGELANLLTGPVAIHDEVVAAFSGRPQSHRSAAFDDELREVRGSLCALANAAQVEVLLGSGTLANDAVAAQLSLLGTRGLVLSNGEFGERLADHAARAGLDFEHMRFGWGAPIDLSQLEERPCDWIWAVACETSAGVLNDVGALALLCRRRGVKLCVDAVSAIGAVPLDLSDVWLATGASGKALASYPGLSFVFHQHPIGPSAALPRYLDLGLYARGGTPFTHSSNLVRALRIAVARVDWPARMEQTAAAGAWTREQLRQAGLTLVGPEATPAPHVMTIALPDGIRSDDIAAKMERAGFLIGHASAYLRDRNWIQLCLMGGVPRRTLRQACRTLRMIIDAYPQTKGRRFRRPLDASSVSEIVTSLL
jgi:aspartate aminotransferase-like enzyme